MTTINTTTRLQAYFKKAGRLVLNEVDGELWASDGYLLFPVNDKSLVAELLAEYNLPFEPMVCDVRRTVVQRKADVIPNLAALLPDASSLKPLERVMVHEREAYVQGGAVTVWSNGSSPIFLDATKVEVTESFTAGAEWMAGDEPAKATARVRDGKAVGLLMPIHMGAPRLRKSVAA